MRRKTNLLWVFLVISSSTMLQASRTIPRSQWPTQEKQDDLPILDQHVIRAWLDSQEEERVEISISQPKRLFSYLGDNTQDNE